MAIQDQDFTLTLKLHEINAKPTTQGWQPYGGNFEILPQAQYPACSPAEVRHGK